MKFHDGTRLSAEEVAYSFEVIRQVPELAAAKGDLLKVLDHVEVVNELQIKIVLKEPYYKALDLLVDGLSVRILPKGQYSPEKAENMNLAVGSVPIE